MSERSIELVTKAGQQFHEIAGFLGALDAADLDKPCPGDGAGTVGAAAVRLVDGYPDLGQFLQAAGYSPASRGTGDGQWHSRPRGRRKVLAPATAVRDLLKRLHRGKATIDLLAGLTDEQLDSVPRAVDRIADGRRTLEVVIDDVIAQQAARLVALRRAVA